MYTSNIFRPVVAVFYPDGRVLRFDTEDLAAIHVFLLILGKENFTAIKNSSDCKEEEFHKRIVVNIQTVRKDDGSVAGFVWPTLTGLRIEEPR